MFQASEIEEFAKKYAYIFRQYGFKKGDGIHMVVGNKNHSYLALLGALYLGGFASCGDVALDSKAISGNVKIFKNLEMYFKTHNFL